MKIKKVFISQGFALFALASLLTACSSSSNGTAGGTAQLGDQLRERGDDAGAASFYQRTLQQDPSDMHSRLALAEILETHGDNAGAAAQYQEVIKQEPDNGEYRRDLGRVFIRMNQPADAKDQYEKALAIDSDDAKAMNGLGISLDYMGKHEAAQKAYKDALNENSNDYSAMNNLAHSYVLVGSYNEAIKLLEPHIKDKAATPALRQNLAEAYGMAGMDADAERVAKIDLPPDQVKQNLAYYKKRRDELSLTPKIYADLGSFPTEAVANSRKEHILSTFAKDSAGLILETMSEVKVIGGTPGFALRARGFARADKLHAFCDKLKKADIACKPHG